MIQLNQNQTPPLTIASTQSVQTHESVDHTANYIKFLDSHHLPVNHAVVIQNSVMRSNLYTAPLIVDELGDEFFDEVRYEVVVNYKHPTVSKLNSTFSVLVANTKHLHESCYCYAGHSNFFLWHNDNVSFVWDDIVGKLGSCAVEMTDLGNPGTKVPSLLRLAREKVFRTSLQGGEGTFFPQIFADAELQDKIEDAVILLFGLVSSRSWGSRASLILLALKKCKIEVKSCYIGDILDTIKAWFNDVSVQGLEIPVDFTPFSGNAAEFWQKLSKSDFAQGLGKVLVFLLSIFHYGICGNFKHFMKSIQWSGASAIFEGGDMILGVLKGFEIVLTKIAQYYSTGSWDVLFHSESTYGKFDEACRQVKVDYVKLRRHDPDVNKHDLLKTIRELINQATNMVNMARRLRLKDKAVADIYTNLIALETLNSDISVKIDAQKPRETPYGVMVCGQSSVGKTSFMHCMHMFKESIKGRKNASLQDIYVRNPSDPFWTNHDSTKTTIVVDDASNVRASRVQGVDDTMNEVIFIVNCVQAMPPYADLADKGQNPLMNDLAIFSTNVENLNIPLYFNCPLAVARRLPVKIEVSVKNAYRVPGGHMLDSSKVPPGPYPDVWNIKVSRCQAASGEEELMCQNFQYVPVGTAMGMKEFLMWYKTDLERHRSNQQCMLASAETLSSCSYCDSCSLPVSFCSCKEATLQAGDAEPSIIDAIKMLAMYHGFQLVKGWTSVVASHALSVETLSFAEILTHVFMSLVTQSLVLSAGVAVAYANRDEILSSAVRIGRDFVVAKTYAACSETSDIVVGPIARLGRKIHGLLGGTQSSLIVLGLVVSAIGAWSLYKKISTGEQADMIGVPGVSKGERESCWKKDEYVLSTFDIPRQSGSLRSQDFEFQINFLSKFICHSNAQTIDNPNKGVISSMLCVKGNVFIGCGHTMPAKSNQKLRMLWQKAEKGLTSNHEACFNSHNRVRVNEDLYTYFITDAQPRKSCEEIFMPRAFSQRAESFDGVLVGRNRDGIVYTNRVFGCTLKDVEYDGVTFKGWVPATCERKTVNGDCGSVLLLFTHSGPMVAGFHRLLFEGLFSWNIAITSCFREDLPDLSDVVARGNPKLDQKSSRFGELQSLYSKSHVLYLEEGRAEVFGSFNVWRSEHRSKMRPTVFHDDLKSQGIDVAMLPAVMSGWRADQRNLKKCVTNNVEINEVILRAVGDSILKSWEPALPIARDEMKIYDVDTALNGVAGLRFVDRMNFSSSAGFPYCASKKQFIVPAPTDEDEHRVTVTNEILEDVEHVLDSYANMESSCTVFQMAKKDEMRPIQKVIDENTRAIYGGQFGFTIVMRQLTLAMTRIMQLNPDVFNLCVGLEAQTAQWDELLKRMQRKGFSKWVAIDFTGFDSSFMTKSMKEAFRIASEFMRRAGATDLHLKYFKCMSHDLMYYMVNFCGTLMQLCGKNPSGHAWTVIINSIANEIYMRYAFVILHPEFHSNMVEESDGFQQILAIAHLYDEFVALATYGDDSFESVSNDCAWFNHTAIKEAMAEFGVTVTMADKLAESKPFIDQDDVSFLKRKFVFNSEFGKHVAPLEPMSIYKSLCWNRLSSVDSPAETLASCVMSATYEWAWHGREVYDKEMTRLHALCDKHSIKYVAYPFDHFVDKFKRDSAAFYADMESRGKTFEQSGQCDYMPSYYVDTPVYVSGNVGKCYFFSTSCEFDFGNHILWIVLHYMLCYVWFPLIFFCSNFRLNPEWKDFRSAIIDICLFAMFVPNLVILAITSPPRDIFVMAYMWRRLVSRRR